MKPQYTINQKVSKTITNHEKRTHRIYRCPNGKCKKRISEFQVTEMDWCPRCGCSLKKLIEIFWIDAIRGLTNKQLQGMKLEFAISEALKKLGIKHEHHSWNRNYAKEENNGSDIWNDVFEIECKNYNKNYANWRLEEWDFKRDFLKRFTHGKKRVIVLGIAPKISERMVFKLRTDYKIKCIVHLGYTVRTEVDVNKAIEDLTEKLAFLKD